MESEGILLKFLSKLAVEKIETDLPPQVHLCLNGLKPKHLIILLGEPVIRVCCNVEGVLVNMFSSQVF